LRSRLAAFPADIFRLRDHRAEILAREGWQEKSVDNLLKAIEAKRAPDAARLLFGLGIRHVGAVTARDLLKRFPHLAFVARYRRLRWLAEHQRWHRAGRGGTARRTMPKCGRTCRAGRAAELYLIHRRHRPRRGRGAETISSTSRTRRWVRRPRCGTDLLRAGRRSQPRRPMCRRRGRRSPARVRRARRSCSPAERSRR
jgi:hypothetical protein